MPLTIGQHLQSRYHTLRALGQGGMGAVYLAEDTRLGRRCAIKEHLPDPTASPQALAQLRRQFQSEARVLANLDHPNLTKVSDYFSEGGNEYLVMDYVEGENLADALVRHGGPLPEKPVLIWADQVLDALEYLHAQRPSPVVHRDIKPANIILTPQSRIKLVDFGLVKLLDPNDLRTATVMKGMGTPEYAPLEQYASGAGHTDVRSDIYSLGATLYHLLTNTPPPDAHQRFVNPARLVPPCRLNAALSSATEAAILRAVELHPDQRWQSAVNMRQALMAARTPAATPQQLPMPATSAHASRRTAGNRRSLLGWLWGSLGGMLTLILVVVLGPVLFPAAPTPTARPMTEVPTIAPVTTSAPTRAPAPGKSSEPTKAPAVQAATQAARAGPTSARSTISRFIESPMLAELVKVGKLPPVDQRLPEKPFAVGKGALIAEKDLPDWTPGKYGGTLRTSHSVTNWNPDAFLMLNEAILQGQGIGMDGIRGNVVESYKVENDNKDFTFKIRKGMKWSDGFPVTTKDVRFTFEDMYGNDKLFPNGVPNEFRVGFTAKGEKGTMTVIDDYTFKISFPKPYGGFIRNMWIEGWKGYTLVINPAHFLKKFHITYTKLEDMQAEMTKMNLKDEWWQYFANKRCQNWDISNPRCADFPGLYPWIIKPSGNPSLLTWERNPYYFKVDSKDQQLPYIDKIVSQQVENVEMVNMKLLTGEIDFMRESTALVKIPLYEENEQKAGFRVVVTDMHADSSGLRLNQTFDDPDWQRATQDVRFRQAVSLAINRLELIDRVYYGHASRPLETVGQEYSRFDPAAASKILDEMGLERKGAKNTRLYQSGKPIDVLLEYSLQSPDFDLVADLTAQYLKAIGFNVTVKQIDQILWNQKWNANQIQATVMWSHDRSWDNDIVSGNVNRAGHQWQVYQDSDGKQGVEPPDWIKKGWDIDARRWQAVSGSDEYKKIVEEGAKWGRDNLPYINYVEQVRYPMVVSVKLGNVPQSGFAIGANFSGEQFYFR